MHALCMSPEVPAVPQADPEILLLMPLRWKFLSLLLLALGGEEVCLPSSQRFVHLDTELCQTTCLRAGRQVRPLCCIYHSLCT